MKKYNGKLAGFPEEIVEKMLERQVEQGNKRNATVFEDKIDCCQYADGFDWSETSEGYGFWHDVIYDKNFDLFFQKYPKIKTYPKVMLIHT